MKRKKKVIAFVSALLISVYGTVPSFSTFADEDGDSNQSVTEETLVSVSIEEELPEEIETDPNTEDEIDIDVTEEISTENALTESIEETANVIDIVEEVPLAFEPVEEESETESLELSEVIPTPVADTIFSVFVKGGGYIEYNIDNPATVYVPYSFLLSSISNSFDSPIVEPTTETDIPTTEPTTESIVPTTEPTNLDENVTIPQGLEINQKGSESENGILYYTNYFSDGSIVVADADVSGSSLDLLGN